jgi:Nucleotidyl transferase AbiEii toxin, Type IV TA system
MVSTGAARQALTKLGVKWEPTNAEHAYNEGRSTQVPVNPVMRVGGRFSRQLRSCLSVEPTLEELLEVQVRFGMLSPALVKKDFYVVSALTAIAAVETEGLPLRLVFGGGTALSRAHRLVKRMSEDIDLRIVVDNNRSVRGALRRLRAQITEALLGAGFKFDPADLAIESPATKGCYTIYRLPYEAVTTGEGALRPTIQIETAVWPLRRPAIELPVVSFMAEALQRPPEVAGIDCVSILEAACA